MPELASIILNGYRNLAIDKLYPENHTVMNLFEMNELMNGKIDELAGVNVGRADDRTVISKVLNSDAYLIEMIC